MSAWSDVAFRGGLRRLPSARLAVGAEPARPPSRIRGFSAARARPRRARERELKALPSAKAAEADFDVMTAEPHHTGSPYEIKLADYVSDQFKADRHRSDAATNTACCCRGPGERRIDIVAPDQVQLEVEEEKIRGDQWADKPGILPGLQRAIRRPATSPARSST